MIEEILSKISTEDAIILEEVLVNNLYNREWCKLNEIDYCNPDVDEAREITYKKYLEKR